MALRDQLLGTEGLGCLVGRGAGAGRKPQGLKVLRQRKSLGKGHAVELEWRDWGADQGWGCQPRV